MCDFLKGGGKYQFLKSGELNRILIGYYVTKIRDESFLGNLRCYRYFQCKINEFIQFNLIWITLLAYIVSVVRTSRHKCSYKKINLLL